MFPQTCFIPLVGVGTSHASWDGRVPPPPRYQTWDYPLPWTSHMSPYLFLPDLKDVGPTLLSLVPTSGGHH